MSSRTTVKGAALAACLGLSLPVLGAGETPPMPQASQPTEQAPYLGVVIKSVPAALAAQLPDSFSAGQGVMVRDVESGSPAEKAGLMPYDILLAYDDQKLFSPEQLTGLVGLDKAGREVKLHLLRRGQGQDLSVTLGSRGKGWGEPLTMRDLRWSRHHPPTMTGSPGQGEDRGVWQELDSLNLQSLGEGRYKASVDYVNGEGVKQHLEFQGTRDEIRKDIQSRNDIPVEERQNVLEALDLDERPWRMVPRLPWTGFPGPSAWGGDWPY